MTFWQWYWIITGLFCWGVFGLVGFMIVWTRLSEKYSDLHAHTFVFMILLAGPFAWLFMVLFAFSGIRKWWRDRRNY